MIGIIAGSQRRDSQTRRVCTYIQEQLVLLNHQSKIFDLASTPLPFHSSSEGMMEQLTHNLAEYNTILTDSEGIIIATPEWNGGATPAIMNALLHASLNIAHKPMLLVSVSSSRGGSYPIAQLRSFGFKNTKPVILPDHLIIHNVNDVLHNPTPSTQEDTYMRTRINWTLQVFVQYCSELSTFRKQNTSLLMNMEYKNGMS